MNDSHPGSVVSNSIMFSPVALIVLESQLFIDSAQIVHIFRSFAWLIGLSRISVTFIFAVIVSPGVVVSLSKVTVTFCAVPPSTVIGILTGSIPGTETYNVSVPALKLG